MRPLRAYDLVVLMSFSGDHDDVPRSSQTHGHCDRLASVCNKVVLHLRPVVQSLTDTRFDFPQNCERVFGSGIVGCQNDDVAVRHRSTAHFGTLAAIPIAAAAKKSDKAMGS